MDRGLLRKVTEVSGVVAGEEKIVGYCLYGSRVGGYAKDDSDYDILLVLDPYPDGLRYYYCNLDGGRAAFLIADEELLEMDAKSGSLGDFLAGRLIPPYLPIAGEDYFRRMEVILKRRICLEECEELTLENGELSRGMLFKPEYVALSRLKRRMKVYPPLRYSYGKLMSSQLRRRSMEQIMPGFLEALVRLEKEKAVIFDGEFVQLSDGFIDKILSRRNRERVINVLEHSQRAIHSYLMHGRAGRVNLDSVAKELTAKLARGLFTFPEKIGFEDPKRFLYLKTASGLLNMEERTSALEAVGEFRSGVKVELKPLGGALNEVFMAEADNERFVVKRFSDWFGFKWFTLNIVALGAKFFSVSGKERLSNEYGMSCHMADKGLPVQQILHVNMNERTLIKEYLEGVNYTNMVKKGLKTDNIGELEKNFTAVGAFMGKVHSMNITLGDTKPENLLHKLGSVVALDLEQAGKGGDKAWDVAEFLYYSGHYSLTLNKRVKAIADSFIKGYLAEGDPTALRKAAGLNYIKVFSFWTPALIIRHLATKLKNTD